MSAVSRKSIPIAHSAPQSKVAESYRYIMTNIDLGSSKRVQVKTILVTSAKPGEGKTSTAANLAITFSESGKNVLLIDANLRNPELHNLFRISAECGLSEILNKRADITGSIVPTEIPNLSLLPGGMPLPAAASLLAGVTFGEVIQKCRAKYDIVLVDSPPVLSVSDPLEIAREVDGVIFVVDSKRTNRLAPQRAISAIQKANENIIGGILNRISRGNKDKYYFLPTDSASLPQQN